MLVTFLIATPIVKVVIAPRLLTENHIYVPLLVALVSFKVYLKVNVY